MFTTITRFTLLGLALALLGLGQFTGLSATQSNLVAVTQDATTSAIDAIFGQSLASDVLINGNGASVTTDPTTGLVTVGMAHPTRRDLHIALPLNCAPGTTPTTATLTLGDSTFPLSETPAGSGIFTMTIPATQVVSGVLGVRYTCAGEAISEPLGRVILYDPSGFVRDATTNEPIAGAVVQFFNVPGYAPKASADDVTPNTCESPATLGSRTWDDLPPADESLGVIPMPVPNLIDPQINPQVTGSDGSYGWDVARGCWYVTVEAAGYARCVSTIAMVGVPPEVLDLHMHLTPLEGVPVPTFTFSHATYEVGQGSSHLTVEVQLSIAASGPVTVQYRSIGLDALNTVGGLHFAAGEKQKLITIPLGNAQLSTTERSRTLTLRSMVGVRRGEQGQHHRHQGGAWADEHRLTAGAAVSERGTSLKRGWCCCGCPHSGTSSVRQYCVV
ncbi:hypothetical protein EYB53_010670 [Candidatus Chloroploca sp. M-50]|uniref:CHRD domain-containing protein n=1 Tax=Candidatus Chloroploca mongolica TaxID=2528176 RepID=A0ABS4D9R2_9CHLR|nr:hypothetical protein [Candidatus Chloroploca mongolica]MBP1466168.1 hypothetical protein [Candidatus Chloroploca mongolica]